MSLTISKFVSKSLDRIEPGQPVVVLLHGYGADEQDLPSLMSFLPDLPWAALRAPISLGQQAFAWYAAKDPLTPAPDDVEPATIAIWDWVEQNIPVDSPLVVLGFSQGGLMATQLLRTRPERLAATVILAGFMCTGEQTADTELTLKKPKVFYGRGANDQMISREAVKHLNVWLQAHTRAQTKTYEGLGHSVDARVMVDVASYLAAQLSSGAQSK
jgi:phospholipase/carboxylesterase